VGVRDVNGNLDLHVVTNDTDPANPADPNTGARVDSYENRRHARWKHID
jgi:hypothetical protein